MNKFHSGLFFLATLIIAAFAPLSSYAVHAPQPVPETDYYAEGKDMPDYLEPMNRGIFEFNSFADRILLHPIASAYKDIVPEQSRAATGRFLRNLASPIVLANSMLQGDVENSFATFWRFCINSTLGLGGLFDVGSQIGMPYKKEDFGLTMGHYGVDHGTYLVLPILGPSSLRDGTGMIVDLFFDPLNYLPSDYDYVPYVLDSARVVNGRAAALDFTDTVDKVSLDPYATYRSGYSQRRYDMLKGDGNGARSNDISAFK